MARVRKPYWLPYSVVNWGVCNMIIVGLFELSLASAEVGWARHFPLTLTLLSAHAALLVLYLLGRAAVVGVDGAARWRQARLPDPGEPPPGNRLAWPAPDGLAPRVATAAARALTQKRKPVPRDLGKGPEELFVLPGLGFMAAVFLSVVTGAASLAAPMPFAGTAIFIVWALWGVSVWVSITVAVVLKTRRLNEDA